MIKINLLKDAAAQRKQDGGVGGGATQFNVQMPKFGQATGSPLVQRFMILLAPIILVYGYGWYSSYDLDAQVNAIKNEGVSLDKQVEGFKPQLDEIEKLTGEKNKITTQVTAIKELSKKRYNYVKILDTLQTLIPEKAWLTKMAIKDRSVSIEGKANDDSTISNFMQNLEESAYFQNVTWESSKEVNEPQGVVKMFNIHFALENLP